MPSLEELNHAARDGNLFLVHVHWNRNQHFPDLVSLSSVSDPSGLATPKQKAEEAALAAIRSFVSAQPHHRNWFPTLKRTAIFARRVGRFFSPAAFTINSEDYSTDLSKTISETKYELARKGQDY